MSENATFDKSRRPEGDNLPADAASVPGRLKGRDVPQTSWKGIRKDFRRNWLFLLILFAGFIYDIAGSYTMYIWLLLLPFLLFAGMFRISKISLAMLVFSISYMLTTQWFKYLPMTFGNGLVLVMCPLIIYYSGLYICDRCKDRSSVMWILLTCIICYAAWPVVTNIADFIETGEIVNLARGFDLDKKNVLATHQNMMMSMAIGGMGAVFLKTRTRMESRFKWIAVTVSVLALFSALHILNRTAIVLAAVSCLCGIVHGGGGIKRMIYLTLIVAAVGAIFYLAIMQTEFGDLIEGFNSREQLSGYTANSAGGRTVRWMRGIQEVITHPFGSEGIKVGFMKTFAHNLWLDIGLRGGWLPMATMFLMTIWWFQSFIRFLKRPGIPTFASGYILAVMVTLWLQMAVEPVVEGQLPLLMMMCLNWAFLKRYYDLVPDSDGNGPLRKK
ncbi:MAG: O-antigen ligase family protein [Muribaculaceae bacterium]|nr:O-antigen ligase family protein [Muribaculaceae bacterium]